MIDFMYKLIENEPYTDRIKNQMVTKFCQNGIHQRDHKLILSTLCNIVNGDTFKTNVTHSHIKDEHLYSKACKVLGFICDGIDTNAAPMISDYIVNCIKISKMLNESVFATQETVIWAMLKIIKLYGKKEMILKVIPLLTNDNAQLLSILMHHFE